MKELWKGMPALVSLLVAVPAFAVDTTQTYRSGWLVVGFLAFCALILVAQLLPSLILLFGWAKGLFKGTAAAQEKERVKAH